jgi:hypothetical protein
VLLDQSEGSMIYGDSSRWRRFCVLTDCGGSALIKQLNLSIKFYYIIFNIFCHVAFVWIVIIIKVIVPILLAS